MYYVRLLKAPVIVSGTSIRALVTITNDLGDKFLNEDQELCIELLNQNDNVERRECHSWQAGRRDLWVEINKIGNKVFRDLKYLVISISQNSHAALLSVEDMPSVLGASYDLQAKSESSDPPRISRHLRSSASEIKIFEDIGNSIARHIWDGALTMVVVLDWNLSIKSTSAENVKYELSHLRRFLAETRTKHILELGSGCGIVGIWLASNLLATHVLVTDVWEAMDILKHNCQYAKFASRSSIVAAEFEWQQAVPSIIKDNRLDLIIVSDCTYNCDSAPALVHALRTLLELSPDCLIVVSMKKRHESEAVFFDLMQAADMQLLDSAYIEYPEGYDESFAYGIHMGDVYVFQGSSRSCTTINR